MSQTLDEMSKSYAESAALLRDRISLLRQQMAQAPTQKEKLQLRQRIKELTPILTDMNAMAEITAKYYQPSHYRDPRISSNCFADTVTRHPVEERYSQFTTDPYEKETET